MTTEFQYRHKDQPVSVRVEKTGETSYTVTVGDKSFTLAPVPSRPGELALSVDGARKIVFVAADGPRRWVAFDTHPYVVEVPQSEGRRKRSQAKGHDSLEAQMPGLVRKVLVQEGDVVERGQVLMVLEAMKMEIRVSAPHAGTVEKLTVAEGETVARGQLLVDILTTESPGE